MLGTAHNQYCSNHQNSRGDAIALPCNALSAKTFSKQLYPPTLPGKIQSAHNTFSDLHFRYLLHVVICASKIRHCCVLLCCSEPTSYHFCAAGELPPWSCGDIDKHMGEPDPCEGRGHTSSRPTSSVHLWLAAQGQPIENYHSLAWISRLLVIYSFSPV